MNITLKKSAAATALGLALAMGSSAAFAQAAPAARLAKPDASYVEMSTAIVDAHKADLDNMLKDMAKVTSPGTANGYESYLNGQLQNYVANHQKLNAAIPSVARAKVSGRFNQDMRKAVDAINALNDKQYTQVAAEMDRLEKLNPKLKQQFDTLRDLND